MKEKVRSDKGEAKEKNVLSFIRYKKTFYNVSWWLPKGSRNNHSPEFTPRFVPGSVDLREHNRRSRKSDVEDWASKDRSNLARTWDTNKMGSDYFENPKDKKNEESVSRFPV